MSQRWKHAFSTKHCSHCDMPTLGQAINYLQYDDYLAWLDEQAARDRGESVAKRDLSDVVEINLAMACS